jgi:hypothetical protein
MKAFYFIANMALVILVTSCVQKTYTKTVIYQLKVDTSLHNITVGVRGNDKPLSWDKDLNLKAIDTASVYQGTVTYKTGYKFTEVKFTINGDYELKNDANRRVNFSDKDTTFYEATFNRNK